MTIDAGCRDLTTRGLSLNDKLLVIRKRERMTLRGIDHGLERLWSKGGGRRRKEKEEGGGGDGGKERVDEEREREEE